MPRKSSSPAVLAHQTQQAEWGRVWHSLSPDQRNGFQALAAQTTPLRANGKPRISAFFLFAMLNNALVNAGKEPITSPPSTFIYPKSLPQTLTLVSLATPGRFALKLAAAPYASAVTLYAAPPVMAGTNIYRDANFKIIGALPSLTPAGQDIAALYSQAFRAPLSGEKITLKLVGVSPTGSTTTKLFVASVTGSIAPSAALANDTPLQMAA